MIRYLPIGLLIISIVALYVMLVMHQYVNRSMLNVLGTVLVISSLWINAIGLKRIGISTLREIAIKQVNFFNLGASLILSYFVFNYLTPGSFEEFKFYYITLGFSLVLYVLSSVEFIKNEKEFPEKAD